MHDWSQTQFFLMPMDEAGYLRINLRGRESGGIVNPGAEYDELCQQIETLMAGLRDEATGKPIAGKIARAYQDADADAACRDVIPDLIVPWAGPAAKDTQRLVSDGMPGFIYEVPRPLPSGRSGNHTEGAWFVAHGPGIPNACLDDKYSVIDLMPTVLEYLGVSPPENIQGRAMQFDIKK
jgi:predicted AlkP superfamily phosphohydrolase/phosphomutase